MGCDIHYVIEQKHNDRYVGVFGTDCSIISHPSWEYRAQIPAFLFKPRNYRFFNALVGVRGDGPNEPLGLPGDISDMTAMYTDYWGDDGHSHSYMSLKEFIDIFLRVTAGSEEIANKLIGDDPATKIFERMGIYTNPGERDRPEDFRVVFWFDN